MNSEVIIEEARRAHNRIWRPTSDEARGDRMASGVTKAWQNAVSNLPGVTVEEQVGEEFSERIDLVDSAEGIAYEVKVSGKNPDHEFFKDVFKVLAYNSTHGRRTVKRFIFITESSGVERLSNSLAKFVPRCSDLLGFKVSFERI